ncbi:uncharacterized protein LOC116141450 isoform X2 [Pistacia vera]|uniref:uncharacterized protein LOC116141450 isoform X2 n=1 Tax=Pistacia vera TaxID=55513 RepID=UPI001263B7D9|nr:uncharacterized protein LOC116141450 isoform X2 [Pistacia vera]
MSNAFDQLEEIKTLISSNSKQNKSFGYSSLLHFQEQSTSIPSAVQAVAQNVRSLIASIVCDISDDNEETAAQALKCLGFMIYHPSLVATVLVDDASFVLQSLTKLIMATKLKSVCNLGVWCISIQQLNASFLAAHFHSLLRAVVYALDNPIGSLSTTFEALQAVMKLAAQLSENMRELSHIWVLPICRRLLNSDKKERDMSERCLLKIKSTMFPPTLALSKALAEEMKQNLLSRMKDLINQDVKIQTIQAWGWFICLLGSHAMKKNRHLMNDMLKVPELTFPDHNPQVQIASLVAWEGLIDTLIHLPTLPCATNRDVENGYQNLRTPRGNIHDIQENAVLKSIKLIMTPLIGIISSKCEVSVSSSCMNTWCYLLHKLDTCINRPSVIKLVLDPFLEAVFQNGPHGKNIWSWNLCLELLDYFILAKFKDVNCGTNGLITDNLSARTSVLGPSTSGKYYWKLYPIKWLPWDLSQVDFFINMISIITCHLSMEKVSCEDRNSACGAVLKIFRSVIKAVQMELKNLAIDYKDIMLCLNSILRFTAKICEDLSSEGKRSNGMHHASLSFIEAVIEELEPSILGSPLYKVAIDLKCIENQLSGNDIKHAKVLGMSFVTYMDMVSPLVYLMVIYIYELVGLTLNKPKMEFIMQKSHKFLKFLFSSCDPLEVLLATNGLLYEHTRYGRLQIWVAITEELKEWIDSVKDLSFLNKESDSTYCLAICHLLSYPFFIYRCLLPTSTPVEVRSSLEETPVSSERSLELELVIEVWKSLYASVSTSKIEYSTRSSFPEDLCSVINGCLDDSTSMLVSSTGINSSNEDLDLNLLCLSGDVVIFILEHITTSEISSRSAKTELDGGCKISGEINNILGLAARFLKLSRMKIGSKSLNGPRTSRVFSALASFVNCLVFQENIVSFFKVSKYRIKPPMSNFKDYGLKP